MVVMMMTAAAFGIVFVLMLVFVVVTIARTVAIFMIVFRHGSLLLLSALLFGGLFRFRIELEPDLFFFAL